MIWVPLVAFEVLLAIAFSALASLGLPRKQVRTNLAKASRMGRFQFGLLIGPAAVFAVLLWVDVWLRSQGRDGGQFLILLILAACLWGLLLGASALPDLFRGKGRSAAGPPPAWAWSRALYQGGLRATPTIMGALLLVVLAVAASLLSRRGLLDSRVFLALFVAALVAVAVAFSVWFFSWPSVLIPRPLREKQRLIPEHNQAPPEP